MTEPKYTPDFEEFWYNYPSRVSEAGLFVKVGKWDAFIQWRKLPVDIRQKCLMLVKNKLVKSSKFTQDACRFLRHRRWEDYSDFIPAQKPTPEQKLPRYSEPKPLIDIISLEDRQKLARKAGIK